MLTLFRRDARVVGRVDVRGARGVPPMTLAVVSTRDEGVARDRRPSSLARTPLVFEQPFSSGEELQNLVATMLDDGAGGAGSSSATARPTAATRAPSGGAAPSGAASSSPAPAPAAPTAAVAPAPDDGSALPVERPGQEWRDLPCDSDDAWTDELEPNEVWLVRVTWTTALEVDGIAAIPLTLATAVGDHDATILDQDGWPELRLRLGSAYTDGAEEADPCDAHASEWWVVDLATFAVQGHFEIERGYAEAYYMDRVHGRASWDDFDHDGHRDVTLHLVSEVATRATTIRSRDRSSGAREERYRYDPTADAYLPFVEPAAAPPSP